MSSKEKIATENLMASDFMDLVNENLDDADLNAIMNKCMITKILSDIRYEIATLSLAGRTNCNMSINYTLCPAPEDVVDSLMGLVKEYFEERKFEVTVSENMISLDWSKAGIEDNEYENAESYENMHKQKAKKQHAPRKHNLRVIK